MRVPRSGPLLVSGIAAAFVFFFAGQLRAQGAVITGRVTTEEGDPLGGASVVIGNTNLGAATAANGSFTIAIAADGVRGQEVVLTARYIGRKPSSRTITLSPGSQEQNFQLAPDPLRLEEVVVTGVGEATARRKLPFAAGSVDREGLQQVPGSSALVALQGKVAAVRLIPTSSQPGGEVAIRLRGATSIGGRQDPLYIVDGVITPFGLADIAPEDLDRVEVIKGAAASSLYGSNAANGVVQVFTNRGASLPEGSLRVTSRIEGGVNNMPKRLEFAHHHAWFVESSPGFCVSQNPAWTVDPVGNYCLGTNGGRVTKPDGIVDSPYPVYLDHWDNLVDPGAFWTGYISVGQRRGTTNFLASVQTTKNQGVIFGLGGYNRQNFRVNIDQQLRSNLDASFSAFYGTSTNGRTAEGQTGPFFGLMFVQPDVDIAASCADTPINRSLRVVGTPYCPVVPLSGDVANDFNPMYELANRKINQDRNRFSGSARLRWRMLDWLSAEGSFGYDQEAQTYSDLTPFHYRTSAGTEDLGSLYQESRNDWQYNSGITLTSVRRVGDFMTNTTKVGASFESQRNRYLASNAGDLVVARVPEFAAADPATFRSFSGDSAFRTRNFLAITTFDIKDRYILDGLVRRDGSSLFGPNNRWSTYYRVSGAWRVTQDMRIPSVDEFRLRASYGTAGLRPGFADQYEVLAVNPGGFTKAVLGNPNLKPAHSAEFEVGGNIEFGGGRYTAEYTFSRKNTTDQLLLVDLPSVAGFSQQWQNTGALRATTHEITLATRLLNTRTTSLTLNIVGDRTRQVITEWSLPERLYSFQQMPSAFFLGQGSNLGAIYGNRWVRNIDDLYDDPAKRLASGPGQTWSRDSVVVNEDGYVVRRSAYGTTNERAIKYTFCKKPKPDETCDPAQISQIVQIGDANPDFNLSFGLTFTHRRLSLNALLDWSKGGDLYNGTRQWAFQATRDRAQDQAGKPQNDAACATAVRDPLPSCPRKATGYYAVGFYNGLDPDDYFVENGTYAKLKELSVSYTFVADQLRRIGLGGFHEVRLGFIARNLFTITKYSGLDPEVSGLFGDPFQVRMDWFQYPQFRTFSTVVEISF
jgi:TonB-linked SusC/RagA family outer membrane protein